MTRPCLIVALIALIAAITSAGENTNVILCMADDLGWGDVAYNGHPRAATPNLDDMAASGLRFDRFYAASPVCSPTRGSCLTGRHPARYDIPHANRGHLKQDEVSLAEVLRDHGYATGHFGKWHLGTLSPDFSGKGPGRNPRKNFMTPGMQGFGEWFSTEYAVATWDPYKPEHAHGTYDTRSMYWQNGRAVTDGASDGLTGCDSRIIMDRALDFIEAAVERDQPFFAVVWFHAPHKPVIGGSRYFAQYADVDNEQLRHYLAVVTALDDQMGRLRGRLRALDVAENTMLFFASDNGPENGPGRTGGFRARKRSLYEGGIRVPAILEWPARIDQPRSTAMPCVTSDYFPTVLAALDITLAEDQRRPLDGVSLMPLFNGNTNQRTKPIGFQFGRQSAWMDGDYKLVTRASRDDGDRRVELYNLHDDPHETHDLSRQEAERVGRMLDALARWQASIRAN